MKAFVLKTCNLSTKLFNKYCILLQRLKYYQILGLVRIKGQKQILKQVFIESLQYKIDEM